MGFHQDEKLKADARRRQSRKRSQDRRRAREGGYKYLSAEHWDVLTSRGLDADAIVAMGAATVTSDTELRKMTGMRALGATDVPGLVLPWHDVNGDVVYHQYRADTPPPKRDGKPGAKYRGKAGAAPRLAVPPAVRLEVVDIDQELWITEGVIKATAAAVAGIAAVGIPGVFGWKAKRTGVLPDWESIPLRGRSAVIAFDSDITSNPTVWEAAHRLGAWLKSRGVQVVAWAVVPPTADGGKQGLDDYLAAGGAPLQPGPIPDRPPGPRVVPSPYAPLQVARLFAAESTDPDTGLALVRHWRGLWVGWTGSCWRERPASELRRELYDRLGDAVYLNEDDELAPWAPNAHRVSDVMDALAAVTHLADDVDQPTWLDDTDLDPREVMAVGNGILHWPTRTLRPASPALFTAVAADLDYDQHAPEPTEWLRFLDTQWSDDPDSVLLLQELFGYLVSGRSDMHKIGLLLGPMRSGKGTIIRTLTRLVGAAAVVTPRAATLDGRFGGVPLLGKSVIVMADARLASNSDILVELLLGISGEDAQTVERKGSNTTWVGRLPGRILMASNEIPRFRDPSGALASRMVTLKMPHSFLGKEDRGLEGRIAAELAGILNWSLAGLRRLDAQGQFTEPASAAELVETMRDMSAPIASFLGEETTISPTAEVAAADLYAAWLGWCDENGREHPGTLQTFGRDLQAQFLAGVRRVRRRDGDRQVVHYAGIRLRAVTDRPRPRGRMAEFYDLGGTCGETNCTRPVFARSGRCWRHREYDDATE